MSAIEPAMKPKKPIHKKWWFWVIVVFVALSALGSLGGNDETTTTSSTSTSPATSAATQATEQKAAPVAEAPAPAPAPKPAPAKPKVVQYDPGMYKVGVDLPAGEYVLVADSPSAYFQISKNSDGTLDSIIANDNFENRSIVTVAKGQYLTVNGAMIVPVKGAPAVPKTGTLPAGMYKVGVDLPAGEYKVTADGDGYVEVTKGSLHVLDGVVSNDNFSGSKYITVKKGQYLKMSRASLKLK